MPTAADDEPAPTLMFPEPTIEDLEAEPLSLADWLDREAFQYLSLGTKLGDWLGTKLGELAEWAREWNLDDPDQVEARLDVMRHGDHLCRRCGTGVVAARCDECGAPA